MTSFQITWWKRNVKMKIIILSRDWKYLKKPSIDLTDFQNQLEWTPSYILRTSWLNGETLRYICSWCISTVSPRISKMNLHVKDGYVTKVTLLGHLCNAIQFSLNDFLWIQRIQWIMTKSKSSVLTRGILYLTIDTFLDIQVVNS